MWELAGTQPCVPEPRLRVTVNLPMALGFCRTWQKIKAQCWTGPREQSAQPFMEGKSEVQVWSREDSEGGQQVDGQEVSGCLGLCLSVVCHF